MGVVFVVFGSEFWVFDNMIGEFIINYVIYLVW